MAVAKLHAVGVDAAIARAGQFALGDIATEDARLLAEYGFGEQAVAAAEVEQGRWEIQLGKRPGFDGAPQGYWRREPITS